MTLYRYPNAWYADALSNGIHAVRRTDVPEIDIYDGDGKRIDIATLDSTINAGPRGGLLFPRLWPGSNRQRIKLAGQGQFGAAWEWDAVWDSVADWWMVDPVCIGVSPVIYKRDGTLVVSHGGDVGSQGYRYLDPVTGEPVIADASYGPRPDLLLYEWTDLGDGYYVGQGPKSGCWLRSPDGYRLLYDGAARFIRASRDGDQIAVASWVEHEPSAVLLATLPELLALPVVAAPPPDAPVITVPDVPVRPALPPVPTDLPPMWIGFVAHEGMPALWSRQGNCSWGAGEWLPSTLPVTEMSPWANEVADRPLLCGLWLSDNGAKPETVDAEIAYAKSRGAQAVYLHCDAANADHHDRTDAAWKRVRAAGLMPVWGNNVNEGVGFFAFPDGWGITLNIRAYGKDPANLLKGIVWAFRQRPAAMFIFGWRDCDWPELRAWIAEAVSRVPTPTRYLGVPEPAPLDEPTPDEPTPAQPAQRPTPKTKTPWAIAAVALAGSVASLVDWFRRKRQKQAQKREK